MQAMDELGSVLAMAALVLCGCVAADEFLTAPDAGVAAAEWVCPGDDTAKSLERVRRECVAAYRTATGFSR